MYTVTGLKRTRLRKMFDVRIAVINEAETLPGLNTDAAVYLGSYITGVSNIKEWHIEPNVIRGT